MHTKCDEREATWWERIANARAQWATTVEEESNSLANFINERDAECDAA